MKAVFTKPLMSWYQRNARDLPWRRTSDPYRIWISEIMLQQTTVAAVIPYYERWMKAFKNIDAVAKTPQQRILKMWQGLGYYTRARNIHQAAKIICRNFGGKFPTTPQELAQLPGFGPYTAGAVASIAFDQRVPIIDANVRRVVMRQLAKQGKADTSHDKPILEFLNQVMPGKNNRIFNQALMELGALVCRNHQPLCLACPVKATCRAYEKGIQELIPESGKSRLEDVSAVIAVIQHGSKFFLQKRPSQGLFANLWEFPGGKIERGETEVKALVREVKEELGAEIASARHILNVQHFYTRFRVQLSVWLCRSENTLVEDASHKWLTLQQLKKYPLPSGSAKIVDHLLTRDSA